MLERFCLLIALGMTLPACATAADDSGGLADAGTHPCRVTGGCFDAGPADAAVDVPMSGDDASTIDAPATIDSPSVLDAPPSIDAAGAIDAPAQSPDAALTTGGTIAAMNMAPPSAGTIVSLGNVVVVAVRVGSSPGAPAEVFIQDPGGGLYSGAHVVCDTMASSPACSQATHDLIAGLQPGAVLSVAAAFAQSGTDPPVLMAPTVTTTGTTMPIVAVTVSASKLEDSQATLALTVANAYVKVDEQIRVSSVTAAKFASTTGCPGGAGPDAGAGVPYSGFDAEAGSTTLAVGFGFAPPLTYCLPGCPGSTCAASDLVVHDETFQYVQGIATVDTSASPEFVRIDPTTDSDMPQ